MIKNTNIQPLKIINVADFLNGEITVEKVYSKSAVQLFIKHRNADRGTIAKALRGVRTHVPRFVVQVFREPLNLSRRSKII
jgi:hypothetical protein